MDDVKELVRLTTNLAQGTCETCGFRGRLDWQITKHNGDWGLLCSDCGFELQQKLGEGGIEKFFSKPQAEGGTALGSGRDC